MHDWQAFAVAPATDVQAYAGLMKRWVMRRFLTENSSQNPAQHIPALESCLLGEFTHRTVNDLCCASAAVRLAHRHSLLSDQRELLERLAYQLDALGTLQRLMQAPMIGGTMDVAERLAALCQAMVIARYADRNIKLRLRIDAVTMEAGRGWRLLLIVAELLVNAARHAFGDAGGAVMVELFGRNDTIVCAVHDNGRGWSDGSTTRSGYGMSVIHMLVQDVGGSLKTNSSVNGTSCELTMPMVNRVVFM